MTAATLPLTTSEPSSEEQRLFSKIARKLLPMLFIGSLLNFIDRANVGFAKLQMQNDLALSDAAYGLGASMFFIGYLLMEVTSNLMLKKVGARLTMLRIMVLWGLASAATAFVTTPMQFYVVRFLLGLFEAGFFPGVVLYLTYWFPRDRRAKVMAVFLMAQVAAAFITSPVSGAIMTHMHGLKGLAGWQWLFLVEGLPTVLMGVYIYFKLPNGPAEARWLGEREREMHGRAMARGGPEQEESHSFLLVLRDPLVYLLAFANFVAGCAGYFLAFWTPTIIKELGVSDLQTVGIYAVIPNFFGLLFMYLYGRHSDQTNEQRLHYGLALVVAAAGFFFLASAIKMNVTMTLLAIIVGGGAMVSASPIFWAMTSRYLSKDRAPAGIAFINTLASASGISPAVVGAIKTRTGSLDMAIYILAALFLVGAVLVTLGMRRALRGR